MKNHLRIPRIALCAAAAVLLIANASGEKSPTKSQCRADAAAWKNYNDYDDWSIDQLQDRAVELSSCNLVDRDNAMIYTLESGAMTGKAGARMIHFLERHDMWAVFAQEDAKGLR